jgi:acyl carrier protein
VREFLARDLNKDASAIGPDDSLLESGTIDSVGVMQLVAFLEQTYGITVQDDDLMPEHFDTLRAIGAFVAARTTGTHG